MLYASFPLLQVLSPATRLVLVSNQTLSVSSFGEEGDDMYLGLYKFRHKHQTLNLIADKNCGVIPIILPSYLSVLTI